VSKAVSGVVQPDGRPRIHQSHCRSDSAQFVDEVTAVSRVTKSQTVARVASLLKPRRPRRAMLIVLYRTCRRPAAASASEVPLSVGRSAEHDPRRGAVVGQRLPLARPGSLTSASPSWSRSTRTSRHAAARADTRCGGPSLRDASDEPSLTQRECLGSFLQTPPRRRSVHQRHVEVARPASGSGSAPVVYEKRRATFGSPRCDDDQFYVELHVS